MQSREDSPSKLTRKTSFESFYNEPKQCYTDNMNSDLKTNQAKQQASAQAKARAKTMTLKVASNRMHLQPLP